MSTGYCPLLTLLSSCIYHFITLMQTVGAQRVLDIRGFLEDTFWGNAPKVTSENHMQQGRI